MANDVKWRGWRSADTVDHNSDDVGSNPRSALRQLLGCVAGLGVLTVVLPRPASWVGALSGDLTGTHDPVSIGAAAETAILVTASVLVWLALAWVSAVWIAAVAGRLPGAPGRCGRAMLRRIAPATASRIIAAAVGVSLLGGTSACAVPAISDPGSGASSEISAETTSSPTPAPLGGGAGVAGPTATAGAPTPSATDPAWLDDVLSSISIDWPTAASPGPVDTAAQPIAGTPVGTVPSAETASAQATPAGTTETALTDTAPTDTAPTDTAPTDTAPTDTAPTDTAPTDTAPTDTAPTNTHPTDTALPSATTAESVPGAPAETVNTDPPGAGSASSGASQTPLANSAAPTAEPVSTGQTPASDERGTDTTDVAQVPRPADAPNGPHATPTATPAQPAPGPVPSAADSVGEIAVIAGDTLWSIAHHHLRPDATDQEIDTAWRAWYSANAQVIGDNPDLIQPGQLLLPPNPEMGR